MNNEFGKFTLAEIRSQSEAFAGVTESIESYLGTIKEAFDWNPDIVIFTGCGTSYYLAEAACKHFLQYNDTTALALTCFELYLHTELYIKKGRKVLVVPFTRCSTTTEVRMTIEKCRTYENVKSLAITCDEGSREYNDWYLISPKAGESSIVMTRSFSSMLLLSTIVSFAVAGMRDQIDKLKQIPDISARLIPEIELKISEIASKQNDKRILVCMGQGPCFGIAGENSIKVKEMVLIPTEVYYTLEYRHGPISIADENVLFVFYSSKASQKYDVELIKEVKALGSTAIVVGDALSDDIKAGADYFFEIGTGNTECDLLPLTIIPGQFLGAHMALERGLNPDIPRNLSKAVII